MNSRTIRWAGFGMLAVSLMGFLFGGGLPIPLRAKFFLGAFGFGTGVVLIIVANILKVKEYEGQEMALPEADASETDQEDGNDEAGT